MEQTCHNCLFAEPLLDNTLAVACRRYPPTITKVEGTTITSYFPLVNDSAWCGEWRGKSRVKGKAVKKIL